MRSIRKIQHLVEAGLLEDESPQTLETLEAVIEQFSLKLTPQIVSLMNTGTDQDKAAIRQQFLPAKEELEINLSERSDPIGDSVYTKVRGLVHRYPDRCLLMPIMSCPVYCRFCFRRETVGSDSKALSTAELEKALDYIREHSEIWEVILTGGDPLMLKAPQLAEIIKALEAIEHVAVVRIHTRIPVVDSERITAEMVQALKIKKAVYVLLHANHPAELTEMAIQACARLVDAGIPMLSQTVLLKGINDTPEVMSALMRCLVRNRIKPYYLHHGELAKGTAHFRTSIPEGQKLMKALRGRYSGLCQPNYVLDIPGGFGKVPIGPSYIRQELSEDTDPESGCEHENFRVEDYLEQEHCYRSPKN